MSSKMKHLIGILSLALLSPTAAGISVEVLNSMRIAPSSFQLDKVIGPKPSSVVACSFLFLKRKGDLAASNACHYNETSNQCEIGTIDLPVEEVSTGGITVQGISKGRRDYFGKSWHMVLS